MNHEHNGLITTSIMDPVTRITTFFTLEDERQARLAQEPFFLGEIAAIVQLVIVGYNLLGNPNDPVPVALGKVLNVIGAVQSRIDQVSSRINSLLNSINALEERIKGAITENSLRAALLEVNSRAYILQPMLKDEHTLRANLGSVERNSEELLVQLDQVRGFSGGLFAGAFNMAPGIALWTQTYTAIQRAKGTHEQVTVWDHGFHKANVKMFDELFRLDAQLRPQYERELREMPVKDTVYLYEDFPVPRFKEAKIPFKVSYPLDEASKNLFAYTKTFACPSPLQAILASTFKGPFGWQWECAEAIYQPVSPFEDPAFVEKAAGLAQQLRKRKSQITNHFRMMANAPQYRQQLSLFVNDKPVIWGGTSNPTNTAIVNLVNNRWDRVNVEVRRGTEIDCGLNSAFETRLVERSEIFSVPAPSVDVCYRRDVDPNRPNGTFTEWRRVRVTSDTDIWQEIE